MRKAIGYFSLFILLFPSYGLIADELPTKKLQMKNNGWMDYPPIYVDSVAEIPGRACGASPVASFEPHPSAEGSWYYDCADDPWPRALVWTAEKYICPEGYQLKDNAICVGFNLENKINGETNCSQPSVGQPISLANGNMYHIETDIHGPLPLIRTYNTQTGKWQFNFENQLIIYNNRVTYAQGDGKRYLFINNGSEWTSDADVFTKLTSTQNHWVIHKPNGTALSFNQEGALEKETFIGGKTLTYTYQDNTLTINDNHQNTLKLEFNTSSVSHKKQLTSATFNDGYVVSYTYNTNKLLAHIKYPDNKTRQFNYDNTQYPTHLTSITNAQGVEAIKWEYDNEGRATVSEENEGERYSVEYGDNQATVTNPLKKQTTYYFSKVAGVNAVTSVQGHASANCAAANREYTYHDTGLMKSKTDWKGITTTFEYNERGLATKQVKAAGTPAEYVTTTVWHPVFNQPTLISRPGQLISYTYDDKGNVISQSVADPGTSISITDTEDYDNDGLTNEQEHTLGTAIDSADTDGDGLSDFWETENNTNPLNNESAIDLDNDGFTTEQELLLGLHPNQKNNGEKVKFVDSRDDWSTTGVQGHKGWYYGYYDYENDANKTYQINKFIVFNKKYWINHKWDLNTSGSPYLEIGKELMIPSGPYTGRTNEYWAIKRWESTYTGKIDIQWLAHKINNRKGNGFTGKLFINGQLHDQQLVAANDHRGVIKTHQIDVKTGDILDFVMSPEGTDGGHSNGWDHGYFYISVFAVPTTH
ncbi:DUF6531 domain-containing protein [Zooshikella harenae]|uniref:RHS repeat protein n=1 Tax=Zooshikella harenae TaxID=2827238 RepID=A0ABS5ZJD6_9GAMM|nr:DUF6531 domain-containing protein [Zooshikella harenae]MBU2714199.1 RHS repeat protein [Zooshikella harenae]